MQEFPPDPWRQLIKSSCSESHEHQETDSAEAWPHWKLSPKLYEATSNLTGSRFKNL